VTERICVAQIGGAHGIRGEVKLKSFTADPMAVQDYGPLESEDGSTRFTIETVRPLRSLPQHQRVHARLQRAMRGRVGEGVLVARFRGVEDRNTAERLANIKLYVPRDRLPPADDDEFYHADLIGLSAVTADGTAVGTIVAIHDFGAGDILELRPPAGGATIMLPFTDAFVPEIDLAGGRIVVALPAETAAKRGASAEGSG
jgi:16S rRNA processing protein RimM